MMALALDSQPAVAPKTEEEKRERSLVAKLRLENRFLRVHGRPAGRQAWTTRPKMSTNEIRAQHYVSPPAH